MITRFAQSVTTGGFSFGGRKHEAARKDHDSGNNHNRKLLHVSSPAQFSTVSYRRSRRISLRPLKGDGRSERVPASPTLPAVVGAAVAQKRRAFRHNKRLAALRALYEPD